MSRRGNWHADAGFRGGLKFRDGFGGFLLVQRPAVPAVLVLQKGNARAFVGFGDDAERLIVQADAAEHFQNFLDVVTVNVFDPPAKRFKTFAINADVVAERRRLALAEAVGIHQGDQIVEFVNARQRCRFPDRALGDFAVAHQDVGVVIEIVQAGGQRHADADAQALAQRAGRHVHERQARRRMTFEVAAELAEFQQFTGGEQAGFRPRGIKQRRGVALGKNKTIVVVVVGILRVVTHVAEKQRGHHVRRRAARSRVSAAGRGR